MNTIKGYFDTCQVIYNLDQEKIWLSITGENGLSTTIDFTPGMANTIGKGLQKAAKEILKK